MNAHVFILVLFLALGSCYRQSEPSEGLSVDDDVNVSSISGEDILRAIDAADGDISGESGHVTDSDENGDIDSSFIKLESSSESAPLATKVQATLATNSKSKDGYSGGGSGSGSSSGDQELHSEHAHFERALDVMRRLKNTKSDEELARTLNSGPESLGVSFKTFERLSRLWISILHRIWRVWKAKGAKRVMHSIANRLVLHAGTSLAPKLKGFFKDNRLSGKLSRQSLRTNENRLHRADEYSTAVATGTRKNTLPERKKTSRDEKRSSKSEAKTSSSKAKMSSLKGKVVASASEKLKLPESAKFKARNETPLTSNMVEGASGLRVVTTLSPERTMRKMATPTARLISGRFKSLSTAATNDTTNNVTTIKEIKAKTSASSPVVTAIPARSTEKTPTTGPTIVSTFTSQRTNSGKAFQRNATTSTNTEATALQTSKKTKPVSFSTTATATATKATTKRSTMKSEHTRKRAYKFKDDNKSHFKDAEIRKEYVVVMLEPDTKSHSKRVLHGKRSDKRHSIKTHNDIVSKRKGKSYGSSKATNSRIKRVDKSKSNDAKHNDRPVRITSSKDKRRKSKKIYTKTSEDALDKGFPKAPQIASPADKMENSLGQESEAHLAVSSSGSALRKATGTRLDLSTSKADKHKNGSFQTLHGTSKKPNPSSAASTVNPTDGVAHTGGDSSLDQTQGVPLIQNTAKDFIEPVKSMEPIVHKDIKGLDETGRKGPVTAVKTDKRHKEVDGRLGTESGGKGQEAEADLLTSPIPLTSLLTSSTDESPNQMEQIVQGPAREVIDVETSDHHANDLPGRVVQLESEVTVLRTAIAGLISRLERVEHDSEVMRNITQNAVYINSPGYFPVPQHEHVTMHHPIPVNNNHVTIHHPIPVNQHHVTIHHPIPVYQHHVTMHQAINVEHHPEPAIQSESIPEGHFKPTSTSHVTDPLSHVQLTHETLGPSLPQGRLGPLPQGRPPIGPEIPSTVTGAESAVDVPDGMPSEPGDENDPRSELVTSPEKKAEKSIDQVSTQGDSPDLMSDTPDVTSDDDDMTSQVDLLDDVPAEDLPSATHSSDDTMTHSNDVTIAHPTDVVTSRPTKAMTGNVVVSRGNDVIKRVTSDRIAESTEENDTEGSRFVRPIVNIIVRNPETASAISKEMCSPKCQNGGVCIGPNTCKCPTLFVGDTCERFSLLDYFSSRQTQTGARRSRIPPTYDTQRRPSDVDPRITQRSPRVRHKLSLQDLIRLGAATAARMDARTVDDNDVKRVLARARLRRLPITGSRTSRGRKQYILEM
ncbi:mucin-3A isoform X2 [Nematostella vectensis]|uniref:mucin-3A isoform X2 n=1 Tax=Nematostella vectensis TaxID=45351 RepID=UPI0020775BE7|nr:mucin-3A isoform X2 [Nematostella vectensis]